jgi:hypothetical protein
MFFHQLKFLYWTSTSVGNKEKAQKKHFIDQKFVLSMADKYFYQV